MNKKVTQAELKAALGAWNEAREKASEPFTSQLSF
jgi:hypothetical protein